MIPFIEHLSRKRLQHFIRIVPRHRPCAHRDRERCDAKDKMVCLTWPFARCNERAQFTMRTHIGLHFQSDGEDAGHDVPARKSGAGSGESEAVGRIGHWVGVR